MQEEGDLLILGVKAAFFWSSVAFVNSSAGEKEQSPLRALLGLETKEYLFWITEDYYCNKAQDNISPEDTRDSERSNNETRQPFPHLIKLLGVLSEQWEEILANREQTQLIFIQRLLDK